MTDYDTDFSRWCEEQAERLRQLDGLEPTTGIDAEQVAEELEGLAREQLREARDHAEEWIACELAFQASQDLDLPRSLIDHWSTQQDNAESMLAQILEQSPSVRRQIADLESDINESGLRLTRILFRRAGLEPPDVPAKSVSLEGLLGGGGCNTQ